MTELPVPARFLCDMQRKRDTKDVYTWPTQQVVERVRTRLKGPKFVSVWCLVR
jgi:hypothetical protein